RVARDVHDALNAFARVAKIDTSRCLAIAVAGMAPVMLQAAQAEPRIVAFAFLDPWTSPVARGVTLARARTLKLPAYLQVGVQGRAKMPSADALLHAGDEPSSRLIETTAIPAGARAFGSSPGITTRLVRWIDGTLPVRGGRPPAPRRPRP